MDTVIVRYGEVALKGKNRGRFVEQLARNIAGSLGISRKAISADTGQLVIRTPNTIDLDPLAGVFGVVWYGRADECANDLASIEAKAVEAARAAIQLGQSFAVRAGRGFKQLPFTSPQIEMAAGRAVQQATQARVDLEHPDCTIGVYCGPHGAYVYVAKQRGPGGMPVGMGGRALCLLSGGFDSIAAAYLLAKRGAQVDFLHFYASPMLDDAHDTKVFHIGQSLRRFTYSDRLYMASYVPFQMATLSLADGDASHELVVFRRFMARVGERLADKRGYQALIFGDSLSQVASQTMTNLGAVDRAVEIPVLRPLIGFDKQEVIDLVQSIGLYELAAAPYKDCCSLIATNPATNASLPRVQRIEAEIGLKSLVQTVLDQVEMVSLAAREPILP